MRKSSLHRWGFTWLVAGFLVASGAVAQPGAAAEAAPSAAEVPAAGEAPAGAGEAAPELTEEQKTAAAEAAFMASLNPQSGKVALSGDLATLSIPEDFGFLNAAETERVLTQAWGNPPGSNALGMIYPRAVGLFGDESWAVVVTYSEDGYVEDDEAEDLDYAELLEDMQKGTQEENEERAKAGFAKMELVGWAEPPHYDNATHKLYWAKDLKVEGAQVDSLNYAIRVLGRRGVLELNAVAIMPQLPTIKREMPKVLTFVEFNPGNRYEDFVEGSDHVAAYGIGALVAGKLAAKAGLFKGLIALLLASKKLIVVGLAALGAALKGLFSRNKKQEPATAPAAASDDNDDSANAA